ncbi:MAG: DUF3147 family protein [Marinobacter sp.]
MTWLITKYAVTAALVVLISEVAKRSDKLGALIAAFPMVTVLAMIWLYVEQQPVEKISNHAWYTFWYVLPTLPMFLMFPFLMARFGFWQSLAIGVIVTIACFASLAFVTKRFGIFLL